jgi:alkylated DNA repair protein (DNA oxidative demethylase)
MTDLFEETLKKQTISQDVTLLKGFALKSEVFLMRDVKLVIQQAPLRQMMTKTGLLMSVSVTNCGVLGWVSDRCGYRYVALDPLSKHPWPTMPDSFKKIAEKAAKEVGYLNFAPDVCLINQYHVGASMGLHQDKDEQDFTQPIVSVSLGIPARFQLGGLTRRDKTLNIPLMHGDVIVWGGEARLKFHGVLPIKANHHPTLGESRINLTFRQAG